MLTANMPVGVAPEVILQNSPHADNKTAKEGIHNGFETQDRRHQKPKRTDVFQKKIFPKNNIHPSV